MGKAGIPSAQSRQLQPGLAVDSDLWLNSRVDSTWDWVCLCVCVGGHRPAHARPCKGCGWPLSRAVGAPHSGEKTTEGSSAWVGGVGSVLLFL